MTCDHYHSSGVRGAVLRARAAVGVLLLGAGAIGLGLPGAGPAPAAAQQPAPATPSRLSNGGRAVAVAPARSPVTAIVGATVINGTGEAPIPNATVVIDGRRITAVGPRGKVTIPRGARSIDGRGLFVLPGFIDVNVHLTPYWNGDTNTTRLDTSIVRAARMAARAGVTTLRDSYGILRPLQIVRDSIRSGYIADAARLLIAGNVIGWGESGRPTNRTSPRNTRPPVDEDLSVDSQLVLIHKYMDVSASIVQGTGEDLIGLDVDSLRVRINQYIDKGVDFIKYGGTVHDFDPPMIVFSESAQRAIVEEAHKRGLIVDTHATSPEGLRMAVLAGVDLVQHADALRNMSSPYPLPDDVARLFGEHRVACSFGMQSWDEGNAKKLIQSGCRVVIGTDWRGWKPTDGPPTLFQVQELVSAGLLSPMEAIVAGTRNGAKLCKLLDQLGTVEAGKLADLVVLKADPLQDIRNLKQIGMVFKEGRQLE